MKEIELELPITDKDQDLLKRYDFSKNIAKKINAYKEENTLTIGLSGEWGSGKTSIINMMEKEIDKTDTIVIRFNPWNFSTRKQLISDFFEYLSEELGNFNKNEALKELSYCLKKYSKLVKVATYIPQLALLGPLANLMEKAGNATDASIREESSLNNLKNKIGNILKNSSQKILIIIDEIDRLENCDIKEIFQLVRALGDFENIIYFLSYDESKVKYVFESGEDYLEKIITLPIYVPAIANRNLNKIFQRNIERLIDSKKEHEIEYWKTMNEIVFMNSFKNIREIKRFVNYLKFNSTIVLKDLNVVDYMVINYLRVFNYKLYSIIKENKSMLLDQSKRKKMLKEFKNIDEKETAIIEKMFEKDDRSQFKRKISCEKYFESYFVYYLDGALSRGELKRISDFETESQLNEIIENSQISLNKYYQHLEEIYSKMSLEKRCVLFKVLMIKLKELGKNSEKSFIESEQEEAISILKELSNNINNYEKIVEIISEIDLNKEYDLHSLMRYYNFIYGKTSKKETIKKIVITFLSNTPLNKEVFGLFKIFKDIGVELEKYIENQIETDEGFINYLKLLKRDIYEGDYPTGLGEDGEPTDYEPIINECIVLEEITDYIKLETLIKRKETLKTEISSSNKELIKLLEKPQKYEHAYAYDIAMEESYKSQGDDF